MMPRPSTAPAGLPILFPTFISSGDHSDLPTFMADEILSSDGSPKRVQRAGAKARGKHRGRGAGTARRSKTKSTPASEASAAGQPPCPVTPVIRPAASGTGELGATDTDVAASAPATDAKDEDANAKTCWLCAHTVEDGEPCVNTGMNGVVCMHLQCSLAVGAYERACKSRGKSAAD